MEAVQDWRAYESVGEFEFGFDVYTHIDEVRRGVGSGGVTRLK